MLHQAALWNQGLCERWLADPDAELATARKQCWANDSLPHFLATTQKLHESVKTKPNQELPSFIPKVPAVLLSAGVALPATAGEGAAVIINSALDRDRYRPLPNCETMIAARCGSSTNSSNSTNSSSKSRGNTSDSTNSPQSPSLYGSCGQLWIKHKQHLMSLRGESDRVEKLQSEAAGGRGHLKKKHILIFYKHVFSSHLDFLVCSSGHLAAIAFEPLPPAVASPPPEQSRASEWEAYVTGLQEVRVSLRCGHCFRTTPKPKPAAVTAKTGEGGIIGGGVTVEGGSGKKTQKKTMSKCGRCKQVRYCSKECQKAHWLSGHKTKCCKGNPPPPPHPLL